MNLSGRPDYSTLEVDDGYLPQAHEQDASNLPEVSYDLRNIYAEKSAEKTVSAPAAGEPVASTASRNICGLRRSTFWIVIVVVLVIITAAAVGGGVGGSEAAKSKSSATTPTSSASTTSSTSAPTSSPTGLLANSALASLNYTDQNNVDHVRVYYQVASKAIYQSAWNSSAKSWTVIPVTTAGAVNNVNTDMDVLPQTPLSANIYWHSSSVSPDSPVFPSKSPKAKNLTFKSPRKSISTSTTSTLPPHSKSSTSTGPHLATGPGASVVSTANIPSAPRRA